jgi:hypothetical protein
LGSQSAQFPQTRQVDGLDGEGKRQHLQWETVDIPRHIVFRVGGYRDGPVGFREAKSVDAWAQMVDMPSELLHADVLCFLGIFDWCRRVIRD